MSKKLLYTASIAVMLFGTACNKYLDITPVGQVIPQTLPELKAEINKAYSLGDYDKGIASFRSDEVKVNEASSFNVDRVRNHYTWDENGNANSITHNWQLKYQGLFYANHLIEAVPKATTGNTSEKNQLLGEAYLLRAYYHFNLVNLYGKAYNPATAATDKAVPLSTAIDMEKVSGRNTVKEVYDQVVLDLEKGLSLVNVASFETASSYKFSVTAANAMAARVYLYLQQYDKALAYAKKVLEAKNTLVDFNKTTDLPTRYNSVETIMAFEMIYNFDMERVLFASEQLMNKYDAVGDLRVKIFYAKDKNGNNTVLKVKANNNFRQSFRVSEMYLIAAEAAAHLNDATSARTYLNTLKKNRLTPAFYATEEIRMAGMTATTLLTEIYEERARELSFEGHRWFDLRRTTQPQIVHQLKTTTYTLTAGDPRYTIRIPKDAIVNNPLLND
ncbi:SusD-like starch-binding protein associating with outer membrane [Chitinophaga skermanii]|uniref:SusD-like starch-binding protein associating with outer membrane n=1 Tax=Chitinophaga skermanii TaxID=331697 RepID=A0A327QYJ3_9BACT|nr:RagB/SusD family nutrient uptake outer membrane protein [Chitinophaga skermanii]RAJ08692.1 SusD-like starch-binding protein associating with outer membrane [Chitinophaga skermanii]